MHNWGLESHRQPFYKHDKFEAKGILRKDFPKLLIESAGAFRGKQDGTPQIGARLRYGRTCALNSLDCLVPELKLTYYTVGVPLLKRPILSISRAICTLVTTNTPGMVSVRDHVAFSIAFRPANQCERSSRPDIR